MLGDGRALRWVTHANTRASYAAVTIFIALKILLVVALGVVEVAQGSYLGGDLPAPGGGERLLVRGFAALRLGGLVGIGSEDR